MFYLQEKTNFHPFVSYVWIWIKRQDWNEDSDRQIHVFLLPMEQCLCTVRLKQTETNIFRQWNRNVETYSKNRFPSFFFTSSYLQCTGFSTLAKYVNFWLSNLVTSFWISGISDKHQYAGMGIEIQLYLRYGSKSVWFIRTAFLRAYQSNSSSSIYAAGN